jgi:integrase
VRDRLQRRVGFRVPAHAFRHTFATVATQPGWNFELLRAAMVYAVTQGVAMHRPNEPGYGTSDS